MLVKLGHDTLASPNMLGTAGAIPSRGASCMPVVARGGINFVSIAHAPMLMLVHAQHSTHPR